MKIERWSFAQIFNNDFAFGSGEESKLASNRQRDDMNTQWRLIHTPPYYEHKICMLRVDLPRLHLMSDAV